jgi:hypothetical protein
MPLTQIANEHFRGYPPEARRLATGHIRLLQKLPLAFVQLLLQQIQEYDWRFPAERREIDLQLSYLESLSDDQRGRLLAGFERLGLSSNLKNADRVTSPGEFSEQLSAYLWSTGQIDAFREAASNYLRMFGATLPPEQLPVPRLGIVVIGKGVEYNTYPLFRKLRPYGTYFTHVNPANGLRILIDGSAARAAAYPAPFGHWYIDGGAEEPVSHSLLISISYGRLAPVRRALLRRIDEAVNGGIGGPEALVSMLHKMRPEEIGLTGTPQSAILSHFQASLLTAGSGTQIFSTTFVQWTTRELWRRAQPMTILARFAPRQRQRPMNELLSGKGENPELDPMGSLIDADMGAFYMWLDQQRLSGAREASFLLWFENHNEALLISPTTPRNTESNSPVDVQWLLAQVA